MHMELIKWNNVLDSFEKQNPRGFDCFYHFHYIHGLEEEDLSPYERLEQIAQYSENDADQPMEDLRNAVRSFILPLRAKTIEIAEEGALVTYY